MALSTKEDQPRVRDSQLGELCRALAKSEDCDPSATHSLGTPAHYCFFSPYCEERSPE